MKAELERAIALERAKKAALLKAAKETLAVHERMHGDSDTYGDSRISEVLRAAIAAAEKEPA